MKPATLFLAVLLFISVVSCKTGAPGSGKSNQIDSSTIAAITGTYLGLLPCADCAQISYRLILNKDQTFLETIVYMGKSDEPINTSGKFTIDRDDIVTLVKSNPGMHLFKKNNEGLLMLDVKGKVITGPTASQYQLRISSQPKQKAPFSHSTNGRKWQSGVEFYARGNESAWTLDMDYEKEIVLHTGSGQTISFPAVVGTKAQDSDAMRYRSTTASAEIIITITANKCTDILSGETLSYQATVEYKTAVDSVFKTLEGCGNYTHDPALSGKWKLIEIKGASVDTSGLPKGAPSMEINPDQYRVSGHGGCNQLSGSFEFPASGRILFGPMISTKMACPDMNTESVLVQLLTQETLVYKVFEGTLTFSGKDGLLLSFRKN